MIDRILKDIDSEESYYVGTNGCLYQDLDKEELLAIKQEIERLNNIINELEKFMDEDYEYYKKYGYAEQGHAMGQIRRIKNKLQELKGSDKYE